MKTTKTSISSVKNSLNGVINQRLYFLTINRGDFSHFLNISVAPEKQKSGNQNFSFTKIGGLIVSIISQNKNFL